MSTDLRAQGGAPGTADRVQDLGRKQNRLRVRAPQWVVAGADAVSAWGEWLADRTRPCGEWAARQCAIWLRPRFEVWTLRVCVALLLLPLVRQFVWLPEFAPLQLEEWTLDLRMQSRFRSARPFPASQRRKSAEVVLMLIDDAAARRDRRLADPAGVPRGYLADAIARIAACEPRVIGIDLPLNTWSTGEAGGAAADLGLRSALARSPRVVLANSVHHWDYDMGTAETFRRTLPLTLFTGRDHAVGPAADAWRERVWIGHSDLGAAIRGGGPVRSTDLFVRLAPPARSRPLPSPRYSLSFAGALALLGLNVWPNGLSRPDQRDWSRGEARTIARTLGWGHPLRSRLIDFSRAPRSLDSFRAYSAAVLFDGLGELPLLRDRIVILGAARSPDTTHFRTPLSAASFGRKAPVDAAMYSAEVHAHAVAGMLNALEPVPPADADLESPVAQQSRPARGYIELPWTRSAAYAGFAALLGVVLCAITWRRRRVATLWTLAFLSIYLYWSYAFWKFNADQLWIPLLAPTALLLGIAACVSWSMRGAEERERRAL